MTKAIRSKIFAKFQLREIPKKFILKYGTKKSKRDTKPDLFATLRKKLQE